MGILPCRRAVVGTETAPVTLGRGGRGSDATPDGLRRLLVFHGWDRVAAVRVYVKESAVPHDKAVEREVRPQESQDAVVFLTPESCRRRGCHCRHLSLACRDDFRARGEHTLLIEGCITVEGQPTEGLEVEMDRFRERCRTEAPARENCCSGLVDGRGIGCQGVAVSVGHKEVRNGEWRSLSGMIETERQHKQQQQHWLVCRRRLHGSNVNGSVFFCLDSLSL